MTFPWLCKGPLYEHVGLILACLSPTKEGYSHLWQCIHIAFYSPPHNVYVEGSSPQNMLLGSSRGQFVPFLGQFAHTASVDLPDFFPTKCLLALCDY